MPATSFLICPLFVSMRALTARRSAAFFASISLASRSSGRSVTGASSARPLASSDLRSSLDAFESSSARDATRDSSTAKPKRSGTIDSASAPGNVTRSGLARSVRVRASSDAAESPLAPPTGSDPSKMSAEVDSTPSLAGLAVARGRAVHSKPSDPAADSAAAAKSASDERGSERRFMPRAREPDQRCRASPRSPPSRRWIAPSARPQGTPPRRRCGPRGA